MMQRNLFRYLCMSAAICMVASCSVYKYVPEGDYLLHKVSVESEDNSLDNLSQYGKLSYQTPNTKWLGLLRIPLRVYSLSGKKREDPSDKNLFRRIGEEPVILDTMLCASSIDNMRLYLNNAGYLKASVGKSIVRYRKPKADLTYVINPGQRYRIGTFERVIPDKAIDSLAYSSAQGSAQLVSAGVWFDASVLDSERDRIISVLQMNGYYGVDKDCISFVADTVSGSYDVNLTMYVRPYAKDDDGKDVPYPVRYVNSVSYVLGENSNASEDLGRYSRKEVDGYLYYYIDKGDGKLRLKPKIIRNHSFISNGDRYDSRRVSRTNTSLSEMSSVRFSNIRFVENERNDSLDAVVFIAPDRKYSFSAELEGTNTAGDFGVAALLSLTDRNIFHGGEQFTLILRGAFEAINNLPGYSGNSYLEYGLETKLDFPKLMFPFVRQEFQRRSQATSELSLMLNSQNRPEFNKLVFTFSWSYIWRMRRHRHKVDVMDINFLRVPWISDQFRKEYLDPIDSRYSILRYNYEDMLLSRIGYSFYYSSANPNSRVIKPLTLSLRFNAETSGNVLNLISRMSDADVNEYGQYKCLGVAFAQYVRSDGEITLNWRIDKWNNLLFHTEYGVAYPYSNSTSVPFEKRFYSGGANGVRGWAVRELGPGVYRGEDDAVNYVRQSGDVKLEATLEFRAHLFWKVNAALFADAGNIWTIREYDEQPGGMFRFNTFYNQIGVSCGAGIRLDFNFLVLRLDYGKQIINPAYSSSTPEHYPFVNKVDYRDYAIHFAIGYPF